MAVLIYSIIRLIPNFSKAYFGLLRLQEELPRRQLASTIPPSPIRLAQSVCLCVLSSFVKTLSLFALSLHCLCPFANSLFPGKRPRASTPAFKTNGQRNPHYISPPSILCPLTNPHLKATRLSYTLRQPQYLSHHAPNDAIAGVVGADRRVTKKVCTQHTSHHRGEANPSR